MRALITGVSGFVGGYLTEILHENKIEVWGTKLPSETIDDSLKDKLVIRDMDITSVNDVEKVIVESRPDYIFHLAAQSSVALSWKKPQLTMDINVTGTLNLLEIIKNHDMKPRILLIGSSEQYGKLKPEDMPVKEEQPLQPSNPYAISKMSQEMLAKLYINSYGMDIVMVRAFNHIGPKQSPIFVVSDFAKRISEIEKGLLVPVLKVGNLEAERDFTDVRDIVNAYFKIIQHGKSGEVYNVGSGKCYKVKYILDLLLSMSKIKINIETDLERMRPSDMPIIQCDNKKLMNVVGWTPQYSIFDTLEDVMNYWRMTK